MRATPAIGATALAPAAPADPNSDAVNAVAAFNPANEDTFDALEQVIDAGQVRVAVLRSPLTGANVERRWAAAYIGQALATTTADQRELRRRLSDADPSVRSLAAYGVLGIGGTDAIPVLIGVLESRASMRNSEPLETLATMADTRLTMMTRADFGFDVTDPARRRTAIRQWRRWWREVRRTIRWDRTAHRYRWRRERATGPVPRRGASVAAPVRRRAARSPRARAAATTTSLSGETLTVTIRIELLFDPSISRSDRQDILANAEVAQNFLNGPGRTGQCLDVKFDVIAQEGAGTPGFHQLNVDQLQYKGHPGYRTSYVKSFIGAGNSRFGRLWTGQVLRRSDGYQVFAHETAHLAGAPDEYTRDPNTGRTTPTDPASFMGDHERGKVLQRHLDDIAARFTSEQQRGCQLWTLTFVPWKAQLVAHSVRGITGRRHFIGFNATADVLTKFWVNPRTGRVTPAGEAIGFDSVHQSVGADAGDAPCDRVRLDERPKRFSSRVIGGELGNDRLHVRLKIGDTQYASLSCDPPPETPGGRKTLIGSSMELARSGDGESALDFSVAAPGGPGIVVSKSFSCCAGDPNRNASGTAKIVRVR